MSETVGPASNELEPDAPATRATAPRASAVRSLHNRNFRLYLTGQVISQTGNWFQVTAEIWLILLITDSATAIGVHSMLRFGPLMLFGIPGGLITDRFDHLRLLLLRLLLETLDVSFKVSHGFHVLLVLVLHQLHLRFHGRHRARGHSKRLGDRDSIHGLLARRV